MLSACNFLKTKEFSLQFGINFCVSFISIITYPFPPSLKTQLLEAQHKIEAFSNTSPTTTTTPSPKEKRRDSPPQIKLEPAGQDSRGSVNRGGVNITNDRVTEVAATEKAKVSGHKVMLLLLLFCNNWACFT